MSSKNWFIISSFFIDNIYAAVSESSSSSIGLLVKILSSRKHISVAKWKIYFIAFGNIISSDDTCV